MGNPHHAGTVMSGCVGGLRLELQSSLGQWVAWADRWARKASSQVVVCKGRSPRSPVMEGLCLRLRAEPGAAGWGTMQSTLNRKVWPEW